MDIRTTSDSSFSKNSSSFTGTIFEIVFLLIIIIIGYAYLVSPKATEYKKVRDNLQSLKEKQSKLNSQKQTFDTLVQELESSGPSVAILDDVLPLDPKPSKLYVLMDNLIQREGLTAGTVNVDMDSQTVVAGDKTPDGTTAAVAERKIKPISVTVSAIGTIDQLSGFLQLVESSSRLLQVNSLDLSQGRADQVIFKVGINAYTYAAIPTATTTPGPITK